MTLTAAGEFAVDSDEGLLACFETTVGTVFSSLCRLTVGERRTAERLLLETYLHLQRVAPRLSSTEVASHWLVLAAHRLYLDDADVSAPSVRTSDSRLAMDWTQNRWTAALDALASLTPIERAALNLREVECHTITEIAQLLRITDGETDALLDKSHLALRQAAIGETASEAFGHTDVWLDDKVRDGIRALLFTNGQRRAKAKTIEASRRSRNVGRMSAVAGGVMLALLARWVVSGPNEDGAPLRFDLPTIASVDPASVGSGNTIVLPGAAAPTTPKSSSSKTVTYDLAEKIPGAQNETTVLMANDFLTDALGVVPDVIVRYTNGRVGLSWHGPCNRPAVRVYFANLADGVGLMLVTGAFPVVSCIGMPDRWTAVVDPGMALSDGPIRPLTTSLVADPLYQGFAEAAGPAAVVGPYDLGIVIGANDLGVGGFGSALVDQANRPWSYLAESACRDYTTTRYQSPVGALFEVRTAIAGELLGSQRTETDPYDCPTHVLVGLDGVFPQPNGGATGPPKNCHSPFGSITDVPGERPYTSQFYDGDWSTWDNCLVRIDVIFSKTLSANCGGPARTITFADDVGQPMGPVARTLTYLRDPFGVVPGNRGALLHSVAVPRVAVDSGLRHGTDELWTVPGDQSAIYVVTPQGVDRWPRLSEATHCD